MISIYDGSHENSSKKADCPVREDLEQEWEVMVRALMVEYKGLLHGFERKKGRMSG